MPGVRGIARGGTVKRRTTMQVFSVALRGEITSDEAARELAPYREAPLSLPRTRWAIVRRPRRWYDVVSFVGNFACVVAGVEWSWPFLVCALLFSAVPTRLVRVPVKIPKSASLEAYIDYCAAICECRRAAGDSVCGCERCGHGRLACDPCDECRRTGLVPPVGGSSLPAEWGPQPNGVYGWGR